MKTIMEYKFEQFLKGKLKKYNGIHVGNSCIILSNQVLETFKTQNIDRMNIFLDADNKAIKLVPNADGYKVKFPQISIKLKENMPRGRYYFETFDGEGYIYIYRQKLS